jgi:hypothetical protein
MNALKEFTEDGAVAAAEVDATEQPLREKAEEDGLRAVHTTAHP